MKLFMASLFTLGLLFVMFLTLVFTVLYVFGFFDWYVLIGLTIALNFLFWLVGPYVSDFIYKWFYKLEWIGIGGLERMNPEVARFVQDVCRRNGLKIPRIGYIEDDNPTSFTYGSGAFNARIVFTKGIFTYLKPNEIKTVFAHEIGHVKHQDFIVMTIASVLVQLFYEMYRILIASKSRKGGEVRLAGAAIGYVFYAIGTYIVLYLSRVREYYADEFAAIETKDPNGLAVALVKIAYGIIKNPEGKKELHLLKSTRAFNIFDFKIAKSVGLAYLDAVETKSWKPIEGAILFDKFSPWAFVSELSSTHPLTGKRIQALGNIANGLGQKPTFDVQALVRKYNIDHSRLYRSFGIDVAMMMLPFLLALIPVAVFAVNALTPLQIGVPGQFALGSVIDLASIKAMVGFALAGLGAGSLASTLYSYSTGSGFPNSSVADLMGDIYVSAVRGRPNRLKGRIVGRGVPGLIFSEDMMFQDGTGLMYLNYESIAPWFGNLVFALTKVDKLIGKDCEVDGWFIRGLSHWEELNSIYVDGKTIKSRVRLLGIVFSAIAIAIGAAIVLI